MDPREEVDRWASNVGSLRGGSSSGLSGKWTRGCCRWASPAASTRAAARGRQKVRSVSRQDAKLAKVTVYFPTLEEVSEPLAVSSEQSAAHGSQLAAHALLSWRPLRLCASHSDVVAALPRCGECFFTGNPEEPFKKLQDWPPHSCPACTFIDLLPVRKSLERFELFNHSGFELPPQIVIQNVLAH
jgi:hypothetical protein